MIVVGMRTKAKTWPIKGYSAQPRNSGSKTNFDGGSKPSNSYLEQIGFKGKAGIYI